mmetsp:Transcript_5519/g.8448  ORF Transcript_5519/g.8448 Transcript_5519/m.8448 type:complete len:267 (-) Transcript_5519:216-1016(-)
MTVNDLPDEVIMEIMTFSSFGMGPMEIASPASRFAHVSTKWNHIYQKANKKSLFATNELRRVTQGMTIRTCPRTATGAGGVETILDCWKSVRGVPPWWTSSYVFEGGHWDGLVDAGTDNGPFSLVEEAFPPTLLINFDRPITIRGVCFWARNKPRLVDCYKHQQCLDSTLSVNESEHNTLNIPKAPSQYDRWLSSWRENPTVYSKIVAQSRPQGKEISNESSFEQFDLPTILPEPITINVGESLGIRIFASQERGWVGINNLLFFE